jgi:hypothetical protein
VVRGDADRLAHRGQPGRAVPGSAGVLERQFRVVVDEATRGDEVPADDLGVARVEATQCRADGRVQVPGVGPLRELRAGRAARAGLIPVGRTPRRAVGTGSGSLRPTLRTALSPVAAAGRTIGGPSRLLRPAVLPAAPLGARGLRPLSRGTTVLPGRTVTAGPVGARSVAAGTVATGTAVLPRRAVTLRAATRGTVPTGTAVLPGRTVTLRAATTGTPVRAVPAGTAVLPRRTVTLRAAATSTAVLPLTTGTARGLGPSTAGALALAVAPRTARRLGTVAAGAPVLRRRPVAALGTIALRPIPL